MISPIFCLVAPLELPTLTGLQAKSARSCGNLHFQPFWPNSRSHAYLVYSSFLLEPYVFWKMKQEIMLHHMGIINIDGYCHARVHAGVTPHSSIFFSLFFGCISLFLLILVHHCPYYCLLQCYHLLQHYCLLQCYSLL